MDEEIVGKYKGKIVRLGLSNGEEVAGTLGLIKERSWVPAHVQLTNASGEVRVEYRDIVSLKHFPCQDSNKAALKTKQEVTQ